MIRRALTLVVAASVLVLVGGSGWQATARAAQGEEGGSQAPGVTLRIAGDKGTPFSGACSVGAKKHEIESRTPRSFEYEPNGRKLACEIRTQDARGSELKVVLEDGDNRVVQRSEGGADTSTRLVYEDGSVASSMSSSTSALGDGRGADGSRESLADRIQKKVARIIERAMR